MFLQCFVLILFYFAKTYSSTFVEPTTIFDSDDYDELIEREEVQLFEGDILGIYVGDVDENGHYLAMANRNFSWPNAQVKFRISTEFNCYQRCIIYEAMREIDVKTCVSFTEVDPTDDVYHYVRILYKDIPAAHVGYSPPKQQELHLSPDSFDNIGVVLHELMHTMGFLHEHTRKDRDNYVIINETNILPNYERFFKRNTLSNVTDLDFPYDLTSVTHYSATAFSVDKNRRTIIVKGNESIEIGQRNHLSEIDVQKIKKYYNCRRSQIGCLDKHPSCKRSPYFPDSCTSDKKFRRNCRKSCNWCKSRRHVLKEFLCTNPVQRCQLYTAKIKDICPKLRNRVLRSHRTYGKC